MPVRSAVLLGCSLLSRPKLWVPSVRQAIGLAPTGWWRHWPTIPKPSEDYLEFRIRTAYGPDAGVPVLDVVAYLDWCNRMVKAR